MDIPVTRAFLPPLSEYLPYLQEIWSRRWVTNHGPLLTRLVDELKGYLGVKHLFFVSNGTLALQIAIKALDLKGEIITTPFSYVATCASICWEGCIPRFADIHPETLCLDPARIASQINENTRAIMPVHVYGNACDVLGIRDIARRHGLKVIYDGAHAFGSRLNGKSLLAYGDIATLSFHATKLFHTGEGGAVITDDDEIAHRISYRMNFGHNGPEEFFGLGINAKNSELHAAMGLAVLPHIPEIIRARQERCVLYDALLRKLENSGLKRPVLYPNLEYNFAYYPVIFQNQDSLLRVRSALNRESIMPRRYFYPALTKLSYVGDQRADIAEDISSRVLCLPLYHDLDPRDIHKIVDIMATSLS